MAAGAGAAPDIDRLRTRSASRRIPRHRRLQPEGLFPNPLRGGLLNISWLPREVHPEDRQAPTLAHRPSKILETRRVCMHPHRPRQYHPHRHRERLRVRPRQGPPPFHRHPTQRLKTQDARHELNRPPPRQEDGEDPTQQALLTSTNKITRHHRTETEENKRTRSVMTQLQRSVHAIREANDP